MKILILDAHEIIFPDPGDHDIEAPEYWDAEVIQVAHPDAFWAVYPNEEWTEVWLSFDLGLGWLNGRDVSQKFAEMGNAVQSYDPDFSYDEEFIITAFHPAEARPMVIDIFPYGIVNHIPMHTFKEFGVVRGDRITDPNVVIRRSSF